MPDPEFQPDYSTVLDGLPAHVALIDGEGIIREVNAAWRRFAAENGLADGDSCIGSNYLSACCDGYGAAATGILQVLAGEIPTFTLEYPCHAPHEQRWFQMVVTPLGKGHPRGAIVMHINVTDRLSQTLNSMTDALLTFDRDWRLTFLNQEAERLLGQNSETLIGRSLQQIFHGLDDDTFETQISQAMERMQTATFHTYHTALKIWFAVRAYPAELGLTVYLRDVTAEHEKDLRLREQAALLDKAKDAIILRDLNHTVLFWNKGAERIYGWKREEVVGKVIAKLLYADPTVFYAATETTLSNGEWTGEIEQITRKGEPVTVDANWTLLHDDNGKPTAILAINTNVTERKRLETNYYRAQRMESIGTLASGIAHDLNNLLAPVVMGVELLRTAKDVDQMEPVIQSIESSAQRGSELVKQILSFAKGVDSTFSPVEIPGILKEIEAIAHSTFPKNVVFSLRCDSDLAPVNGDATRLNQVFLNICVNARDAMPDGGEIKIHATNEVIPTAQTVAGYEVNPGTYVRIDIADTGNGIPKSHIDRIFDPFYTTKPPGYGTGLGLATSLGIIRSHNGFISVTSKPGLGSQFSVFIPSHEQSATAKSPPSPAPQPQRGQGQTILVVDDEKPIVAVIRQTLVANGYTVMDSADGAEAIALFAMHHGSIDLVLTDLMMPGIDGPTLIAAIRKIKPDIRVIAASGLHTSRQVAKASEIGIQHFLAKPYSAAKLLEAIDSTLNSPSAN